jgi:hypothetical protein
MSQREAVEKTLGEHKYTMYMLPPRTSNALLVKVVKMVGPSIGPLFDMFFNKLKSSKDMSEIMDEEIGVEFFQNASSTFFEHLDNDIINEVLDQFAKVGEADGHPMPGIFDLHFMGDLGRMYKWMFWGMQVQWGKSLGDLIGQIPLPSVKETTKKQ